MINRRKFLAVATMALAHPGTAATKSGLVSVDYGASKLDIYLYQANSPLPVLVYVHGGAWQTGRRSDVDAKPAFLGRLGFLFVSIDYRLGPFAKPDRQRDDVAAAYAWVRTHVSTYGGDPGRIVMMGHSAGSHLAALAALSGQLPDLHGLICNDIQMYDIGKFAVLNGGDLPRHYGYLFGKGDRWDALSPAYHIGQHPMPPVLVCYSDMRLSQELSLDFAERLKRGGVTVSTFDGRAYKHREINRQIGADEGGISAAIAGYLKSLR